MKKNAKKMLIGDVAMVLGFLLFLWVTMCFIIHSIIAAVSLSHAKNIIIASGVVSLLFATLSLFVLIFHLNKNKKEVYGDEILHAQAKPTNISCDLFDEEVPLAPATYETPSNGGLVKMFDILFIMVLCFVTLLATMLLRGKTVNGESIYVVGIPSVLVTVVGFTVYFVYILRHSHKELKLMVEDMYRKKRQDKFGE